MVSKTKFIVLASFFLTFASVCTVKQGWGEIYPFFTWKLFSQPRGWELNQPDLRVYAKKKEDTHYQRLENKPRATFNRDEVLYFLHPMVKVIKEKHRAEDSLKLKIFCKHIAPEFDQYKIVLETYNPLEVIENIEKYDTTTAILLE